MPRAADDPRDPSFDVMLTWHPRWRIWNADSGWWARRRGNEQITREQADAGMAYSVRCGTLADLHEVLSAQEVLRGEHTGVKDG